MVSLLEYVPVPCSHKGWEFIAHILSVTDKEAVQALESRVKEERKQAGEMGLLFAGRYLLLIEKFDKAKEYLDRAIKMGSNKQVC